MVILEKNNFRLCTITRLIKTDPIQQVDLPIIDGLAIEKKTFNDCYYAYYAICFVEYNQREKSAGLQDDMKGRLLDLEANEWDLFKKFYKIAKQLVELANIEED